MLPGLDAFHSYDLVDLIRKLSDAIQAFFNGDFLGFLNNFFGFSPEKFSALINFIQEIAIFVSAVLLCGVVYYGLKIWKMHLEDDAFEHEAPSQAVATIVNAGENKNKARWSKIVEHSESNNSNDWKIAIMEADIMLDDMLDKQGYHGESIGDKLKQVEKSDFSSIDEAWEAHKVRNQIAHEGSDFILTQRKTREVIGMYEKVFREFYMI